MTKEEIRLGGKGVGLVGSVQQRVKGRREGKKQKWLR